MKRGGGVPPIVTVLVTIASVVAASLVAWFLWTTTRSATQQPILEVTSAYVTCAGSTCTVSFTVRNTGAVQFSSISPSEVICETTLGPRTPVTPPSPTCSSSGQAAACTATFNAVINDGASCTARLEVSTSSGRSWVTVGFKVIRP